nr:hypothetical protein [Rhizobium giardinii]
MAVEGRVYRERPVGKCEEQHQTGRQPRDAQHRTGTLKGSFRGGLVAGQRQPIERQAITEEYREQQRVDKTGQEDKRKGDGDRRSSMQNRPFRQHPGQ